MGAGDWAKAWESCSRFQPNHFFTVCTWSPSPEARVSSVQLTFPLVTSLQSPRPNLSLWLYNWNLTAFSFSLRLQTTGKLKRIGGQCKNAGWRIYRVTIPFIFPQDKRTAQDTVIWQTLKQNKTGLLLIQTNGHSCRSFHMKSFSPQ